MHHRLIIPSSGALFDEVHHIGHLFLGDEAALYPLGLALSKRGVKHISLPHQLFCTGGVQNNPGLHAGGHRESDTAGDIGLHQTGDHISGGTLRCDDQVHTRCAAHLGHSADGFLHLLGGHQHQIGQLVDDHHDLG